MPHHPVDDAVSGLTKSISLDSYRRALALHPVALRAHAQTESRRQQKSAELEHFYHEELPKAVKERRQTGVASELWVTKAEGSKIVSWKHVHGKNRPNQRRFDEQNSPEAFGRAVKAAAEHVVKCEEAAKKGDGNGRKFAAEAAIKTMQAIKFAGPATSSAILSTISPHNFAYFSDQSTSSFFGGRTDLKYTNKEYSEYLSGIWRVQKLLNDAEAAEAREKGLGGTPKVWSAVEVESVVWADAVGRFLKVPEFADEGAERISAPGSRKRSVEGEMGGDVEGGDRLESRKRIKMRD